MSLTTSITRRHSGLLRDAAALVVVVAGLKAAAPLVTQLLLVVFATIVVTPLYFQLVRWRLPPWLALTLLISSFTVIVFYGSAALITSLTQLAKQIPDYYEKLTALGDTWLIKLEQMRIPLPDTITKNAISKADLTGFMRELVSTAGSMLSRTFVVVLLVSFILWEAAALPKRLRESSWITEELWTRLQRVVVDVRHYMVIKTVISAATGIAVYIALVLLQIDSPLVLGFTAFLLNYVPTVGSIIAGIPAVLIALGKFSAGRALAVAAVYIVINQVLGVVIEPRVMGKGFGISPVLVLVSLLFWGWVLGPVGMLLSVPLTMGLRVVLGSLRENPPLPASGPRDTVSPSDATSDEYGDEDDPQSPE